MKTKVWYKWPEGYVGSLVPWYLILRRLAFWPMGFVGFLLLYFAILLGWGLDDAEDFRKDVF